MTRREVLWAIFGVGSLCPRWLERLMLSKYSTQIKETPRHSASARDIVERVLKGSDDVDEVVKISEDQGSEYFKDPYFRGLHNGLLMAQAQLQDCEYKPI